MAMQFPRLWMQLSIWPLGSYQEVDSKSVSRVLIFLCLRQRLWQGLHCICNYSNSMWNTEGCVICFYLLNAIVISIYFIVRLCVTWSPPGLELNLCFIVVLLKNTKHHLPSLIFLNVIVALLWVNDCVIECSAGEGQAVLRAVLGVPC